MKKLLVAGLAIVGSLGVAQTVLAGSVTTNFVTGTVNEVEDVTAFNTFASMMQGMVVTAYFSSGDPEEKIWGPLPSTNPGELIGVQGNGWSLQMSGNTFSGLWTLTSSGASITSLVLDGMAGNTIFDKSLFDSDGDPVSGTSGSGLGGTFSLESTTTWDLVVTYSDAVRIPYKYDERESYIDGILGDIFGSLTLGFYKRGQDNSLAVLPFENSKLTFKADTDNINPIPEPATLLLFATGLAGLAAVGRRRHI